MNILLTGATGFVGQHFLQNNNNKYQIVTASVRQQLPLPDLSGIDAIVHLGGKAHEMKPLPDEVYFSSNAELTKHLAEAAKKAGVSHFIYVSSVKVYGNKANQTVNENSPCHPDDAYGKSKLLAEQYVQQLEDEHFTISIVRPPLVYGAGVKGNMLKLMQLAGSNVPLPFGNIHNKRSIVYVGNLIALIHVLLDKKMSGVFIAGDQAPLSTTQLVTLLRKSNGKKTSLLFIPKWVQRAIKTVRPHLYVRLFGSFVIDNSSTNLKLGFVPPVSTETGMKNMVTWFKNSHQ